MSKNGTPCFNDKYPYNPSWVEFLLNSMGRFQVSHQFQITFTVEVRNLQIVE